MKQRLQNITKKCINRGYGPLLHIQAILDIQASHRDFILEIRECMSSCGSLSHSFSNAVFRPWMVLGGGLRVAIALPRAYQACSMELRLGDLAGQYIQRIS